MGIAAKSPDVAVSLAQHIVEAGEFGSLSFQSFVTGGEPGRTANYTRDLSATDDFTFSFWYRPSLSANGNTFIINAGDAGSGNQHHVKIEANSSSQLRIVIRHSANGFSDGISYTSSYGILNNNSWNHVMYSYDQSANNLEVATNDTDRSASNSANGNNNFDGDATETTFLGRLGSTYGNGCLAEILLYDQLFDASSSSGRRKFISALGKPVSPPTSPLIHFKWGTYPPISGPFFKQFGSTLMGESLTVTNMTNCATSPSD